MPLFDHLNRPSRPEDDPEQRAGEPRLSRLLPGRAGRPSISLEALRERVESQFQEEIAGRDDILAELDSEESQRAFLREVAEYVFAVEAVTPSAADRRAILDKAYHNLFGFGPLDALLEDETVSEISIAGPSEVRARRGAGPLELAAIRFDDMVHLGEVLRHALATAGQGLTEENPFVEAGVRLRGRPARISAVGPPVSALLSVTIRLHPPQPLTLDDLVGGGFLSPQGATLLRAILNGGYGLLIVGEAGTGKTTLAGALACELALSGGRIVWVERAAELPLPDGVQRFAPGSSAVEETVADFGGALRAALAAAPDWLALDEARTDEALALWEALTSEYAPRYLWTMRAPARADRLRSALVLMLHRAQPAIEPDALYATLAHHLPFVVILGRAEGVLRLLTVGEWTVEADGLRLCPLLAWQQDGWRLSATGSVHSLNLPPEFWS